MSQPIALVLDDEDEMCGFVEESLKGLCRVLRARTASSALQLLGQHDVECVLLDQVLPDMDTLEFLEKLSGSWWPPQAVVMATVPGSVPAVSALEKGACACLVKPFPAAEVRALVAAAVARRKLKREHALMGEAVRVACSEPRMVGSSAALSGIRSIVRNVADADAAMLITGETGTGKEMVARLVHASGRRGGKPFCAMCCASTQRESCEVDAFGAEGAERKVGRFEMADGGTVFIDNIEWLAAKAQERLLAVLQEKSIMRVGGTRPVPLDLRIIAATTQDLREAVARGTFRQDLYWRLAVVNVHIPPLRERPEDIPELLSHFLELHACRFGRRTPEISPEAMEVLRTYRWPGNVDELDHVVQHVLRSGDGSVVRREDLPMEPLLDSHVSRVAANESGPDGAEDDGALRQARQEFERLFIMRVLEKCEDNQVRAARLLGVHRNTLINKMNELNLRASASRPRKRWLEAASGGGNAGEEGKKA